MLEWRWIKISLLAVGTIGCRLAAIPSLRRAGGVVNQYIFIEAGMEVVCYLMNLEIPGQFMIVG